MIKECLKKGHKIIRKGKEMLQFIFGIEKEEPKENIIFAKREAQNVPEKHNVQYMKREPNFNKIAEAFKEDKPKTICMDDHSMDSIIDKADYIDSYFDYDYEFNPADVKYIEEKMNTIYKELDALEDYVEKNAIEV